MRLDMYDKMPSGMDKYLQYYGWHFSKKLCEHAVSNMKLSNGSKVDMMSKEDVDNLLKRYGVEVEKKKGYDCVFVACMAKADYYGSSVPNEECLARFIKDYIDDPDGYDGLPMTRYFADVIGKGEPIIWDDMI